jgi:ferric-dicitrate binding protein FerR (iron transport regulator)
LTNNGIKLVKNVDIEHVIAWKNGFFSFQDASLAEVMKQLSRWYDLDIVYEGKIPEIEFNGEIHKDLTLSQVLNGLSATRINYIIKNEKTIIIRP